MNTTQADRELARLSRDGDADARETIYVRHRAGDHGACMDESTLDQATVTLTLDVATAATVVVALRSWDGWDARERRTIHEDDHQAVRDVARTLEGRI